VSPLGHSALFWKLLSGDNGGPSVGFDRRIKLEQEITWHPDRKT
jgi:hypothetical protein